MNKELQTEMFVPPVLVWTVGKVASSSIYATLQQNGHEAFHVHYLSDWHLTHQVNRMYGGRHLPLNIVTSLRFRHGFDRNIYETPIRIVTLVRDPLARNISAYFENLKHFGKGVDDDAEAHVGNFLSRYPHEIVLDWFDAEVRDVTGIDYRDLGFDPDRGWCIHRDARFELLIMRAEDDDAVKLAALSAFFERPITEMMRQNEAANKAYNDLYRAFRDKIALPQQHIDFMYDNEFCATFYNPSEIHRMKAAWAVAAEPPPATERQYPVEPGPAYQGAIGVPVITVAEPPREFVASDAVSGLRSEWISQTDGFEQLARLRVSFALNRAITNPALQVEMFAKRVLVSTFTPRPGPARGEMNAGEHAIFLSIADLLLTPGLYDCVFSLFEDGELVHCAGLSGLNIYAGGMAVREGLIAPSYQWVQTHPAVTSRD